MNLNGWSDNVTWTPTPHPLRVKTLRCPNCGAHVDDTGVHLDSGREGCGWSA